jgi:hypothetical protein
MKTFVLSFALVVFSFPFSTEGQSSLTNGLAAFYPFNGNALDESGNGNNGVVHGATLGEDRFGVPNQAYYFDGTNSYIELPSSTNAFGSDDFTISIWFKPLSLPNPSNLPEAASFLISKGQNNFELSTGSTVPTGMTFLPRFIANGYFNQWSSPAGTFETNAWQQVVATYKPSGSNVAFFINGNKVPLSGPLNIPLAPDILTPARLGMRFDGTLPFKGYLDSVRIYNRALSSQEVSQLFNDEAGPAVSLIKAVRPAFQKMTIGTTYQLQVSDNGLSWTNQGSPFVAQSTNAAYNQYWDVENWDKLFFRLRSVSP